MCGPLAHKKLAMRFHEVMLAESPFNISTCVLRRNYRRTAERDRPHSAPWLRLCPPAADNYSAVAVQEDGVAALMLVASYCALESRSALRSRRWYFFSSLSPQISVRGFRRVRVHSRCPQVAWQHVNSLSVRTSSPRSALISSEELIHRSNMLAHEV